MSDPPDEELSMTFWEHLEELRSRILRAAIAFAVGVGFAWYFRTALLKWLVTPLVAGWGGALPGQAPSLNIASPADAFIAYLKLALIGGFVLALPFIFYQLWAFVAPGLYSREKKFALPFVGISTLLFCGGGLFGWKVAFPIAFRYLLSFLGDQEGFDFKATIMVGEYVTFVSRMLLAFGVVFELPVLVFFLSFAGIINHTHLIKFFRYFVVIAFVLGAVLTPPDILSQFLLAVPLMLLYLISIGIAWTISRRRQPPSSTSSS